MSSLCRNTLLKGIANKTALTVSRTGGLRSASLPSRLNGRSSLCFSTCGTFTGLTVVYLSDSSHVMMALLQSNVAPIPLRPAPPYLLSSRGLVRQGALDHPFLSIILVSFPRNCLPEDYPRGLRFVHFLILPQYQPFAHTQQKHPKNSPEANHTWTCKLLFIDSFSFFFLLVLFIQFRCLYSPS